MNETDQENFNRSAWWPPPPTSKLTPFEQFRDVFNPIDTVPLFRSYETYTSSLPLREMSGEPWCFHLCRLPYYVVDETIEKMVEDLEKNRIEGLEEARSLVKYISSPSGSGKSASIFPAFLKSVESGKNGRFTHYLHLAFDNNGGNHYLSVGAPGETVNTAESQGAQFMSECIRRLVNEPQCILTKEERVNGGFRVTMKDSTRLNVDISGYNFVRIGDVSSSLGRFLSDLFSEQSKILVHIDEHKHIMRGHKNAVAFRRGAMAVLAMISNVRVIATFIQPILNEFNQGDNSSGTCRYGVTMPIFDVVAAMSTDRRLLLPFGPGGCGSQHYRGVDFENMRLLGSYLFILSFVISLKYKILSLHIGTDEINRFFDQLKEAVAQNLGNTEEVLKACIYQCREGVNIVEMGDIISLKRLLLAEVNESQFSSETFTTSIQNLMVVDKRITCSLRTLLQYNDPDFNIYTAGRDHFKKALLGDDSVHVSHEILTSTPLEAAYIWTLSCKFGEAHSTGAFPFQSVRIGNQEYQFKCNRISDGRIFPSQSPGVIAVDGINEGTIYYPDESSENDSHPLGDIFFWANQKAELVLIDVTGGGNKTVAVKYGRLKGFIENVPGDLSYRVRGIILAPWADEAIPQTSEQDSVNIVASVDARRLLGGLLQIRSWFEYTVPDNQDVETENVDVTTNNAEQKKKSKKRKRNTFFQISNEARKKMQKVTVQSGLIQKN